MLFPGEISFTNENTLFNLENKGFIESWIRDTIQKEGKLLGEISYVFCSDDYLLNLNKEHLGHDTLTDIITFEYNVEAILNSDIFISIERVRDNATTFNTSFNDELCRVIIHGILHLVGYDDKSDDDRVTMRAKEDFYLSLLRASD